MELMRHDALGNQRNFRTFEHMRAAFSRMRTALSEGYQETQKMNRLEQKKTRGEKNKKKKIQFLMANRMRLEVGAILLTTF